ncbi:MAG: 50S ribosomal protein L20, partial [Candidatus Kapaibacterium sp.]
VWTVAKTHIEKGLGYAYRDRRAKTRIFRRLWIVRINAAARMNGTTYSRLINALHVKNISINRKVLADLAMNHPNVFSAVVKQAMA